jgi:predicted alpha/beta-fold hydrolase
MSKVQIKITPINELPVSKSPWSVVLFNGRYIFANAEHEPRIFHDGTFEVLRPHHIEPTANE